MQNSPQVEPYFRTAWCAEFSTENTLQKSATALRLSPSLSFATAAGVQASVTSRPCASTSVIDSIFQSVLKGQRRARLMLTGGSLFGRAAECRITHIRASNQYLSVSRLDVRSWLCSPIAQINLAIQRCLNRVDSVEGKVTREPRVLFAISKQC